MLISSISATKFFTNKKQGNQCNSADIPFQSRNNVSFGDDCFIRHTTFKDKDGKEVSAYIKITDSPEYIDVTAYEDNGCWLGTINGYVERKETRYGINKEWKEIRHGINTEAGKYRDSSQTPRISGIGTAIMREYEKQVAKHPEILMMVARIINTGSARFHNKMGFAETAEEGLEPLGEETFKMVDHKPDSDSKQQ